MSDDLKTPQAGAERQLFLEALGREDPADRAAYLDAACAGDPTMRRRVEELLRAQVGVGSFLDQPALLHDHRSASTAPGGPHGTEVATEIKEVPGDRIGRYKLLQKIGEGGCGVVYMAEQEEPVRRRVALKVIKLGMDTRSVIARFEAERQALAMMEHANIAKVLDAGATETGRPYFVMELVRGIRITEYCDANGLSTRDRVKLFVQVCNAIQHAHQKGVIHRDIKPSNILITLHDGVPVPKVIDFGIAKATEQRLTEKTLFTEYQSFIGTPAYTSPEQAEMSGLDIDTRSDIYSLGVLLYELITGQTPFDPGRLINSGLYEMRRIIREEEPLRPSTRLSTLAMAEASVLVQSRRERMPALVEAVRGDLDWIVMKCLDKDRTRRYEAANGLALDVQRYLDDEPVLARPPSNLYRLQKMLRRHRGAVLATSTVAASLIVGAGISVWQAVRATWAEQQALASQRVEFQQRQQAEQERERAERERASARLNEYVADINLALHSLKDGNIGRAVQLLNKHRPVRAEADLRGFEWRYLWQLCRGDQHDTLPTLEGPVQSVAFSPDGAVLAAATPDRVTILDRHTRKLLATLQPRGGAFPFPPRGGPPGGGPGPGTPPTNRPGGGPFRWQHVAFLPGASMLVTATPFSVRVWSTADWTEKRSLTNSAGPFAVSRDGLRLAAMAAERGRRAPSPSRGGVRIWNTQTWQEERLLPQASGSMVFSPDGRTVATDSEAGLTLWRLDGAGQGLVLEGSTNFFSPGPGLTFDRPMAFSPDGRFVVAARNTLSERGVFVLSIWSAQSGKEVAVMPEGPDHVEHTGVISGLAFSPDGNMLATASLDYSIRLWDFARRERVATLQGNLSEVWTLAFSGDGLTIASGAKDGGVKLWKTRRQPRNDVMLGASMPLGFSKDGQTLAVLEPPDSVAFINSDTMEPEQHFPLEPTRFGPPTVAISSDLRILVQGLRDGSVAIRNTESGDTNSLKASERPVDLLALSPDGRMLVTGGRGQMPRLWDLRVGTNVLWPAEPFKAVFSPDGRTLAAIQLDGSVLLWDVPAGTVRTNLVLEVEAYFHIVFSPDSRVLAVSYKDDTIRLWETATGRLVGTCVGHKQPVTSMAFSPDGRTLASAGDDSTLRLWNLATQQELFSDRRLGGGMGELLFSPDGRLLVGARSFRSPAEGVRFFRAPLLSEIGATNGSDKATR